MACRLLGVKPLHRSMVTYHQLDSQKLDKSEIGIKIHNSLSGYFDWKRHMYIVDHQASSPPHPPPRRQAIIWTDTRILLNGPLRINLSENFNRNQYIFVQENAFQNVVCEMAAI